MLEFKRVTHNLIQFSGPAPEVQMLQQSLTSQIRGARVKNFRMVSNPHEQVTSAILPWNSPLLRALPAVGETWTSASPFGVMELEETWRWADHEDWQDQRRAAERGLG